MSKKEKFLSQLESKISKFDKESFKHKQMHRTFRYVLFSLAALTSILSGVALSFNGIQAPINLLIVVIGGMSGVITSVEGLRRPNELWIMERNVYYALLDLKEEYEFEAGGSDAIDVDLYYSRMQLILNSTKEKWSKMIRTTKAGAHSDSLGSGH